MEGAEANWTAYNTARMICQLRTGTFGPARRQLQEHARSQVAKALVSTGCVSQVEAVEAAQGLFLYTAQGKSNHLFENELRLRWFAARGPFVVDLWLEFSLHFLDGRTPRGSRTASLYAMNTAGEQIVADPERLSLKKDFVCLHNSKQKEIGLDCDEWKGKNSLLSQDKALEFLAAVIGGGRVTSVRKAFSVLLRAGGCATCVPWSLEALHRRKKLEQGEVETDSEAEAEEGAHACLLRRIVVRLPSAQEDES